MFSTFLDIDFGPIDALREVAPRLPDLAPPYFAKVVVPAIQTEVDRTIGADVPAQRIPWGNGFLTDKSRRWYFANKVPKGSRVGHYLRRTGSDAMENQWVVVLDRRSRAGLIMIHNTDSASGYVYGPENDLANITQTPGHRVTGWGNNLDNELAHMVDFSMVQLLGAWNYLIEAIMDGKVK